MGGPAEGAGAPADADRPTDANTDSRRVVSGWPSGHAIGSVAWLIGRRASNLVSQVRQRYS